MDYRILGPLEVWAGDRPVPLGGEKQRALLAILPAARQRVGVGGRAHRRGLGGTATRDRSEDDAGLYRSSAQGARSERAQDGGVIERDLGDSWARLSAAGLELEASILYRDPSLEPRSGNGGPTGITEPSPVPARESVDRQRRLAVGILAVVALVLAAVVGASSLGRGRGAFAARRRFGGGAPPVQRRGQRGRAGGEFAVGDDLRCKRTVGEQLQRWDRLADRPDDPGARGDYPGRGDTKRDRRRRGRGLGGELHRGDGVADKPDRQPCGANDPGRQRPDRSGRRLRLGVGDQ